MDPWYFLDGFDYKVKDGNDNRFELYDLLEVYPSGSWYVNSTEYGYMTYAEKSYTELLYINSTKTLYCKNNGDTDTYAINVVFVGQNNET